MTFDRLKFASGRALRSTALHRIASLPDPNFNPGSIALTGFGTPSIPSVANSAGVLEYRQLLTLSAGGRLGGIGHVSNTDFAEFVLVRGRATPTIDVPDGYILGSYSFAGRFPSGAAEPPQFTTCHLRAFVNGTPTSTSYPTAFDVSVTPPGATLPVLGLRLTPSGNLLLGNTTGTEKFSVTGNVQLTNPADSYKVGTNNVVGSRKAGWTAPTGTATRTAFATSSVTTEQLAERLKALIDDLIAHGLIGA